MKTLSNEVLQFSFEENGSINVIKSNEVFLLEKEEVAEFYLRILDEDLKYYAMLKHENTKVLFLDDKVIYKGCIEKVDFEIILMLEKNMWIYSVNLIKGDDFLKVDVVYTQSINIHLENKGVKLFIDNVLYESHGYKIATLQNQKTGKDNSYVQLGCTYHTKGFNIYKNYDDVDFLNDEEIKCEMKSNNFTNYALQTSEIFLANNKVELFFYGYFVVSRNDLKQLDYVEEIIKTIVNHDFTYYEKI